MKTNKVVYIDPPVKKVIEQVADNLDLSQKDFVTGLVLESLGPEMLAGLDLTDYDRSYLDFNFRRLLLSRDR
jgi:hypothetical protein